MGEKRRAEVLIIIPLFLLTITPMKNKAILTKCQVYVILVYSNFSPEKCGTQQVGMLDVTVKHNQITD